MSDNMSDYLLIGRTSQPRNGDEEMTKQMTHAQARMVAASPDTYEPADLREAAVTLMANLDATDDDLADADMLICQYKLRAARAA